MHKGKQPDVSQALGNDIVDLYHSDARTFHPRFPERICTESEWKYLKNFIPCSSQWLETLWIIWSIKESAYKAIKQIYPDMSASWNSFETVQYPGYVRCQPGVILRVKTDIYRETKNRKNPPGKDKMPDYIHTITCSESIPFQQIRKKTGIISSVGNESEQVRRFIEKSIMKKWKNNPDKLTWSKHISGAPVLSANGMDTPYRISFSHHGRYLAYVLLETE